MSCINCSAVYYKLVETLSFSATTQRFRGVIILIPTIPAAWGPSPTHNEVVIPLSTSLTKYEVASAVIPMSILQNTWRLLFGPSVVFSTLKKFLMKPPSWFCACLESSAD